jgi:hypothetical protein
LIVIGFGKLDLNHAMMTNVYGKVCKNLRHFLRINACVKRVVLCLQMQNNLKITMGLVLTQSDKKWCIRELYSFDKKTESTTLNKSVTGLVGHPACTSLSFCFNGMQCQKA